MEKTLKVWRLKRREENRIKARHPWVFSNELQESPKGTLPGEAIELQDFNGNFLAYGYGNPKSLIAFRALSFADDQLVLSQNDLLPKLLKAFERRIQLGFRDSFRWVFSEADHLPGLVIDRYVVGEDKKSQVFSWQILTAGIDALIKDPESLFTEFVKQWNTKSDPSSAIQWNATMLIDRSDVQIRKLEGLEVPEPRVIKGISQIDPRSTVVWKDGLAYETDLLEGQKTGLFLDQSWNHEILTMLLHRQLQHKKDQTPFRILDLCCYLGAWTSVAARTLKKIGIPWEAHLIDVSNSALERAKKNVSRSFSETIWSSDSGTSEKIFTHHLDIFKDQWPAAQDGFDLVICDPPALIKGRKDIEVGAQAYFKINHKAMSATKDKGLLVSCSCSGLLQPERFQDILQRASTRAQRSARNLASGGLSLDHSGLLNFPEGNYLKTSFLQLER